MIVCRQCGHENEDQSDFCHSCRAYLEWDGERTAGQEGGTKESEPVRAQSGGQPGRVSSPTPPVVEKGGDTPQAPAAVPPGEERKAPPPRRTARGDAPEGGLVCSSCGHGNEPSRTFCRRCGHQLDVPKAAAANKSRAGRKFPWGSVARVILCLLAIAALVLAIAGPPWEHDKRHGEGVPSESPTATSTEAQAAATSLLQAWIARDRAAALGGAEPAAVDALFSRALVQPPPSLQTCHQVARGEFDCQFDAYLDSTIAMRTGLVGRAFRVQQVAFVAHSRNRLP